MAAALLVAVAVATAVTLTSAILTERADVAHLAQANIGAERLLSDLKDAESGQRGFLLTGQQSYLQPYGAAVARLRTGLAVLQQAATRDGVMSAPVAALERLVPEKLDELARTIELQRGGDHAAALKVVESGQGNSLMEAARAEVAKLGSRAALADEASDAAVRRWLWIGTAAVLAFLAAGVALGFRLLRERQLTLLALSRAEVNIRAALDAIPQMVWSARADGYHDYYNRRWYEFTGASPGTSPGRTTSGAPARAGSGSSTLTTATGRWKHGTSRWQPARRTRSIAGCGQRTDPTCGRSAAPCRSATRRRARSRDGMAPAPTSTN